VNSWQNRLPLVRKLAVNTYENSPREPVSVAQVQPFRITNRPAALIVVALVLGHSAGRIDRLHEGPKSLKSRLIPI
jgi:hypothetical protein